MKYFILLSVFVFLTSCSTNKVVKFDQSKLIGKTIVFHMTNESQLIKIQKTGTSLGESYDPDNIEVFKKSLIQLSEYQNLNLVYTDDLSVENDYLIIANFKKAVWHFGFSNATMTAEIEYILPNDKKITIEGVSKVFGVGTKSYHLLGAFVNANSKVMEEISR